jgi:uncharacterized protein YbjT (DUF2867 family)
MRVNRQASDLITGVEQLEDLLSEPTPGVVETLGRLEGDLLVLGVAGKMGPTLARMARRASDVAGVRRRIIGVARFTNAAHESALRRHGVETIRADILDQEQLDRLPDAANIVYLVGMKFGSTGQEAMTWAVNCFLPGMVCRRFSRSQLVALSTGNVYGLTPVALGGSRETDALQPVGDYALSCVGRERIFEHFSRTLGIPLALLRLNYANELRYGVLVDLAQRIQAGHPINLAMGHVNAIWQADANAMVLQAFDHLASPPFVLNLAGPELLSVRRICDLLGRLLGREAVLEGVEAAEALLSNGQLGHRLCGYPRVGAEEMIERIADWVQRGGESLGKPTHFEVRDGKF